jgi:hypothetical protein
MNGEDDDVRASEELRARIGRLDPGRDRPVRSHDEPASRQQLERIMTIAPQRAPERRTSRRLAIAAAAAAVVVVALVGGFLVAGDDDDGGGADVAAVELQAGASDVTASCLPVDAAVLADMPVAFKGTVESAEGDTVTLAVDAWYAGGESDTVRITAPQGLEALIGGVEFAVGEQYLVSATDGVVNYCGFSGPATADLQAVYDAAFGG